MPHVKTSLCVLIKCCHYNIPKTAKLLARKGPLLVMPLTTAVTLRRVLSPAPLCIPSPIPHTPPTVRPGNTHNTLITHYVCRHVGAISQDFLVHSIALIKRRTECKAHHHTHTHTLTCHVGPSCSVKHLLIPALFPCLNWEQELWTLWSVSCLLFITMYMCT